jgi:Flp pilus assembly protein TadG
MMMKNINLKLRMMQHRGAVAIEFALLLIPLLMIVTGVIEFGRAFWYYDALAKSTRDAARFLSNTRVSTAVAIDAALKDQAKALVVNAASLAQVPSFSTSDVDVSCNPDCDAPTYVTVSINAYPMTIGGWIPVFIPTGATSWSTTFSPYTTMRYMR